MITSRSFLSGLGALLAAPAVVLAEHLMPVRSIARLILPGFSYESFDSLVETGKSYHWVAGDDLQNLAMRAAGWLPVPAEKFNDKFYIPGENISYGNCTLMERPVEKVVAARREELLKARQLESEWKKRFGFRIGQGEAFRIGSWSSHGPASEGQATVEFKNVSWLPRKSSE